ncbi:hypothetical protein MNBD_GAMMA09-2162 [hydrothermal vent metagenome]|uniref:Uncharacterized protein n=1 Tax=hydrothermal vent metagenome TaxID=652676 RepID=A0A3B0Y536_9ZZZZ
MKDTMIDMMVVMMPYMKPFMWFAAAVAIAGFVFIVASIAFKKDNKKTITWTSRIVLIAAFFFMAAQAAGIFLNMPPTVNFGDSSKFEFILVSFWQIGLVFLVTGIILKVINGFNKTAES